MTELTSEISRLTREVEAASEEQGTYLAYDKRVKELAAELTLAQVGGREGKCKEYQTGKH